jgi:hypothetical protein
MCFVCQKGERGTCIMRYIKGRRIVYDLKVHMKGRRLMGIKNRKLKGLRPEGWEKNFFYHLNECTKGVVWVILLRLSHIRSLFNNLSAFPALS